jgi:hypothetical protein
MIDVWGADLQVQALKSSVLAGNAPIGVSLTAKLNSVIASLAAGATNAACNQLNAFINEVMAQSGKKITTSDAKFLIDQAQQIRAVLACP